MKYLLFIPLFFLLIFCQKKENKINVKFINHSTVNIDSIVIYEGVAKKILIDKILKPNEETAVDLILEEPKVDEGYYNLDIYQGKVKRTEFYAFYDWGELFIRNVKLEVTDSEIKHEYFIK